MEMKMKFGACAALYALCVATPMAAYAADSPIRGNIRIVLGSDSTGGDTYQAAGMVAEALSEKLDANFKVDAVGVSAAFKTLERVSNGRTMMIHHDQAYLGHLYEQKGYEDIFNKFIIGPTLAINPGNAFLVSKKSPYKTAEDIIEAAGQGKTIKVAIQPGGVSEIGYSALKNAIHMKYPGKEDNLQPLYSGSQSNKDQTLFDGLSDMISGSIQASEQYTRLPADDQKAMRFVWITTRKSSLEQANAEGFGGTSRDELLQYVPPMVKIPVDAEGNDFTFDKEFFFLYNKKTDPKIIAAMDKALAEVLADEALQKKLKKSFFIPDYMPSKDAQVYLKKKNDQYAEVIEALKH